MKNGILSLSYTFFIVMHRKPIHSPFDGFGETTFTAALLGSSDGAFHIFLISTSHFLKGKKNVCYIKNVSITTS